MENAITRKRIILGGLALIAFLFISFLLNNSFLTIHNPSSADQGITILRDGSPSEFTLPPNGSKRVLLKRGDYEVQANEGNKASVYTKTTGSMWFHRVDTELRDQRKATSLGFSTLSCARDNGTNVLYYACPPKSAPYFATTNNGFDTQFIEHSDVEQHSGDDVKGSSLKQLTDGIVEATSINGLLKIELRPFTNVASTLSVSTTADFKDGVNDLTFSVLNKKDADAYAVLDREKKEVLLFKNLKEPAPARINISKEASFEKNYLNRVFLSERYTYVLNALNTDVLDGDDGEAEGKGLTEQKVVVIDNVSSKVVAQNSIPDGTQVRSAYVSPEGALLVDYLSGETGNLFYFNGKEKLDELNIANKNIDSLCWKDSKTFYFISDESASIYTYSFDKKASYLAYNNPKAILANLNCNEGQLHFSAQPNEPKDIEGVEHFVLSDKTQDNVQLETLTPLYVEHPNNLFEVRTFRGSVVIKSIYTIGEGGYDPNQIKNQLIERLKQNNVDTAGLNLVII